MVTSVDAKLIELVNLHWLIATTEFIGQQMHTKMDGNPNYIEAITKINEATALLKSVASDLNVSITFSDPQAEGQDDARTT
jgi:hypothetical protein